jgi:hypothetical protein
VHLVRVGIGLFDLSKDDRTCDVSLLCLDTGESGLSSMFSISANAGANRHDYSADSTQANS